MVPSCECIPTIVVPRSDWGPMLKMLHIFLSTFALSSWMSEIAPVQYTAASGN